MCELLQFKTLSTPYLLPTRLLCIYRYLLFIYLGTDTCIFGIPYLENKIIAESTFDLSAFVIVRQFFVHFFQKGPHFANESWCHTYIWATIVKLKPMMFLEFMQHTFSLLYCHFSGIFHVGDAIECKRGRYFFRIAL